LKGRPWEGPPITPEPCLHLPGIYIRYAADAIAMGSGTVGMDVFPSASADCAQRALEAFRP
jgi:hypothetical protein